MQTDTPSAPPSESAAPPDVYDPETWPEGCEPRGWPQAQRPAGWTEGQWSYVTGVMHQHGVALTRSADGGVLPFEDQDELGRWEVWTLERDKEECRARCAVDRKYRREIRAIEAADKLGRSFFDPMSDVDMARAATLPPVTTARRTTSRARGAGRPAGRPSARRASRSSSGDDDSGDSDPEPARAYRLVGSSSLAAIAAATRVLDREAHRLLAEEQT